ncbi:zinc metalloproteinase nas-14 [Trichonephila inaurata madagascariensis]|uniref:Metalloendopeptidase n=1 Tax=Trichonephila inaurata madagascariensis TaxID=2747483 RepID=A0A8X6MG73_9ARAC|nr:zinc metalloproteinase nas-14 [Trichonephila inaurata madagascariensis]
MKLVYKKINVANVSFFNLELKRNAPEILGNKRKEGNNKGYVPLLKWKRGQIPYVISRDVSPNMTKVILDAIKYWNVDFRNCIEWVPYKDERDFVLFMQGPFCHSEVGRMKHMQLIVLNEANCNETGFVLHEMMHTVGFIHEHNRPDRNNYIKILLLNIPYEWRKQYEKESLPIMEKLGPYDYYSLMHYEIKSPDRNKPAFQVVKNDVDVSKIGQRTGLSKIDKLKVKNLYCPSYLQ